MSITVFPKKYELNLTPNHRYMIVRKDTGLVIGSYLHLIDAKKKCKEFNNTAHNDLFHVVEINDEN